MKTKNHSVKWYVLGAFFAVSACLTVAHAQTFSLPPTNESIIGQTTYVIPQPNEITPTLAHRYSLGQNAVIDANPGVTENSTLPNEPVTVPTEFLLPPLGRNGIVINLPEMRMYYYPKNSHTVMTFPIGIGKIGKVIPIKNTSITRKKVNPTWTPPEDIRQFNREQGVVLPKSIGPGPDNPLGPYAIYLKIPTFLIHSTIFPESIGRRASFGCIRMNEDDIREFFPVVEAGIPVIIVDMPNKVAWQNNSLYMEAHPPLEERSSLASASLDAVVENIERSIPRHQLVIVDWQLVAYLTKNPDGRPHEIGVRVR